MNAPVVANRPGLLRVYVKPADGWTAKSLAAELRLASGGMDIVRLTCEKRKMI